MNEARQHEIEKHDARVTYSSGEESECQHVRPTSQSGSNGSVNLEKYDRGSTGWINGPFSRLHLPLPFHNYATVLSN